MKKLFIFLSFLLVVACKKDNYKAPDSELSGNIIDAATGKNVPQQSNVNGGYLQLFQTDYPAPTAIQSAFYPDGSFVRGFIFSGNYKVVAFGPFIYQDTLKVNLNKLAKLDIKVIPYLAFTCEVLSKTSTSITVGVKVSQPSQSTQKIVEVAAVAAIFNTVDINNYDSRVLRNTQQDSNSAIVNTNYEFTISNLKPGTLYYVRSGGRTVNNGNFYNYSTMMQVTTNAQ